MIDIKSYDKARVLLALYNASHVQGMGFLAAKDKPLTIEECRNLLDKQDYFDYLFGKVMKISLSKNQSLLDERLYDRDNGSGAAYWAILEEFTKPDKE